MTGISAQSGNVTVLLYSHSAEFRATMRTAVGRRPAPDLPRIDWVECANYSQVQDQMDSGDLDLAIFDGDAQPTGGLGLARQFKYEITNCPPIIVTLLREVDRWLAAWALADDIISHPIDPVAAAQAVADVLRSRAAVVPVVG
jgi:DNA-binding NtrC family response regulator